MRGKYLSLLVLFFAGTLAHADSYSQPINFNGFYSTLFNPFDLSKGTLTSVTLSATVMEYAGGPPDLVFKSELGTSVFEVAATQPSVSGYYTLSGSGTLTSAADLAALSSSYFPTPRYQFSIDSLSPPVNEIGYVMGGATVTFNYTPAASAPEIDPSLSASGLILIAGALAISANAASASQPSVSFAVELAAEKSKSSRGADSSSSVTRCITHAENAVPL